jgi:hypothetical protein
MRFRFPLRDLFWLILVFALAGCLAVQGEFWQKRVQKAEDEKWKMFHTLRLEQSKSSWFSARMMQMQHQVDEMNKDRRKRLGLE